MRKVLPARHTGLRPAGTALWDRCSCGHNREGINGTGMSRISPASLHLEAFTHRLDGFGGRHSPIGRRQVPFTHLSHNVGYVIERFERVIFCKKTALYEDMKYCLTKHQRHVAVSDFLPLRWLYLASHDHPGPGTAGSPQSRHDDVRFDVLS